MLRGIQTLHGGQKHRVALQLGDGGACNDRVQALLGQGRDRILGRSTVQQLRGQHAQARIVQHGAQALVDEGRVHIEKVTQQHCVELALRLQKE